MGEYTSEHALRTREPDGDGEHHEISHELIEQFIPLEQVEELVAMAMVRRVDENGVLLPLTQNTDYTDSEGASIPLNPKRRYDLALPLEPEVQPTKDGGELYITQDYNVPYAIYAGLTQEHSLTLVGSAFEHVQAERAALEELLTNRSDFTWYINEDQAQDSYRIDKKETPSVPEGDESLVAPVRIYVPGGTDATEITRHALESGADFASAKVWVPRHGEQNFRADAPIFIVDTFTQLHDTLVSLREVAQAHPELFTNAEQSPVGVAIEGVPGAYIAQPNGEVSFNYGAKNLWGKAIQEASHTVPIHAGEKVTQKWLEAVAVAARKIAFEEAEKYEVNQRCHALLSGQDVELILDAARMPETTIHP